MAPYFSKTRRDEPAEAAAHAAQRAGRQPHSGRQSTWVYAVQVPADSASEAFYVHKDLSVTSKHFRPLQTPTQLDPPIKKSLEIPGVAEQLFAIIYNTTGTRELNLRTLPDEIQKAGGKLRADVFWWLTCNVTEGLLKVAHWLNPSEGKKLHMLFKAGSVWIHDKPKDSGKFPHVFLCANGPSGDEVTISDLSWCLGHIMIEMLTAYRSELVGLWLQCESNREDLILTAQENLKVKMPDDWKRDTLGWLLWHLTCPKAEKRLSLVDAVKTLKLLNPDYKWN